MKSLLVLLLSCVMIFGGCNEILKETTSESTTTKTEAPIIDEKIWLVENGVPMFKIVSNDTDNFDNAKNLQETLNTKTNVSFQVESYSKNKEYERAIFVGRNVFDEELEEYFNDNVDNMGFASVYMNGNIYLCGYTAVTVAQAVTRFTANIPAKNVTVNDNKKVDAYLPNEVFFLSNPGKEVKNPLLLGNNFRKYNFVISANETSTNFEVIKMVTNAVSTRTGAYIEIVSDGTKKTEYEIVLGNTTREVSSLLYKNGVYKGDILDYSFESSGNSLAVGYGGKVALYAVIEGIIELVKTDQKTISKRISIKDTLLATLPLEKKEGSTMRVMTSNVLFSTTEYGKISSQLRMEFLGEYYIALNCDIVGLQECFYDNIRFLDGAVSKYFAFVPFVSQGQHCPESTIYRKDRYTLEDYGYISLNYPNMPNNKNLYQFTWSILKSIESGEIVVHGNVHYHYYSEADRLIQTKMVNAELKKLLAAYPKAIFVVTGDYNSAIDSAVHKDMISGTVLKNSVHVAASHGVLGSIDHFMVNPETTVIYYQQLVSDSILKISSDHYPVIIDISEKPA